jgi:hypothetical protein
MSDVTKVSVVCENSSFDDDALRGVATIVTDRGTQTFRGSWSPDEIKALESLVGAVADVLYRRSDDDRRRHQEERAGAENRIAGLRTDLNEMREYATKSGLTALLDRLKVVQREKDILQAEVVRSRAALVRINAAVDNLVSAAKES